MGLSIGTRGTRTGGRTEKKNLILQFSQIHVQNVWPGLMRTSKGASKSGQEIFGSFSNDDGDCYKHVMSPGSFS